MISQGGIHLSRWTGQFRASIAIFLVRHLIIGRFSGLARGIYCTFFECSVYGVSHSPMPYVVLFSRPFGFTGNSVIGLDDNADGCMDPIVSHLSRAPASQKSWLAFRNAFPHVGKHLSHGPRAIWSARKHCSVFIIVGDGNGLGGRMDGVVRETCDIQRYARWLGTYLAR